ncbi:MAG: alpha/beta fold hydrolase [Planctomycetes bacterium]|nr:alpha/beta fold hydrolase [Planctomycetota bacterium]
MPIDSWPYTPRFHTLRSGSRMHYVDEGPRQAETLLCVHGNPSWGYLFRPLVAGLSSSYRLVVPDHAGCGRSDKPFDSRYRLAQHVDNLEELVLALDLSDLTLVLHDWGGAIGMGLAARRPERIRRLVLMNTAAYRSSRIPLRIAACRWPLIGELALLGANAFVRAALAMAVERPLSAEARAAYLAPFPSWSSRKAQLAFVRDIPMRAGHPSWDTLVEIEQSLERFADRPALLVWGERDWCFTTAFRDEWRQRLPHAESIGLPRAGHWLLEDEPDAVVAHVRDFLARHPLR